MTNMPSGGDLGSAGRTTTGSTAQQVKDTVRDTTNNITNAAKDQARNAYDKKKNVVFDEVGNASFVDPHTVEFSEQRRIESDKIILCAGGSARA